MNLDPRVIKSCVIKPRRAFNRGDNRGFTLVELLVTIGIIALLASIALPVITSVRRNAERNRVKIDLQAISQALEAYKQVFNDYPRSANPDNPTGKLLGRYLLGFNPSTNVVDGLGVRFANDSGRKWGPYLPLDKFRPSPDGSLIDTYGTEIQYYPKWKEYDAADANPLLEDFTAAPKKRGMFNRKEGIATSDSAHRDHVLYMLGDGVDASTGGNQPNGKIDGSERLTITPGFILVSAGHDRKWSLTIGETRRSKVDDVYNFER